MTLLLNSPPLSVKWSAITCQQRNFMTLLLNFSPLSVEMVSDYVGAFTGNKNGDTRLRK